MIELLITIYILGAIRHVYVCVKEFGPEGDLGNFKVLIVLSTLLWPIALLVDIYDILHRKWIWRNHK